MRDTFPLTHDGKLLPSAREDLADVDLVVVLLPSLVLHPPVAIILELIAKLITKFWLVVPSFVLVTEPTVPLAGTRTPRIPNVEQLELLGGCHVLHS